MKKAVWSAVAAVTLLALAAPASAQNPTVPVTATVQVGQWARLEVSGAITFTDADPETVPTLTAAPVTVTARARVAPTEAVSVTVIASHEFFDHVAATNVIPVADLDWTSSGSNFAPNGTMSHTTAQTVANWSGPSNNSGTQTYSLPNSWDYPVGNHQVTLTYTLVLP